MFFSTILETITFSVFTAGVYTVVDGNPIILEFSPLVGENLIKETETRPKKIRRRVCNITTLCSLMVLKEYFIRKYEKLCWNCNFWYRLVSGKHNYTHIHNWPLQPFSQDYGLACHTTHVVCVNFIRVWRDLQFNVDSERQFFEKLFHDSFILLSEFLSEYVPNPWRLISRHTTY